MRSSPAHPRELLAGSAVARRVGEWAVLVRPRVGLFVLIAAVTGGLLAAGPEADLGRVFFAALLVGAVASSASVFNQILERDTDRLMRRTADRPLVRGTIGVRDATLFAGSLALLGTVGLAVSFNPLSALLALSTLLTYVLVYTPLKRHSSLNTVVGAVPGAMPPFIAAVAMTGAPTQWAWMLFALVFAWQFPHFLAIAWLYREDYRRAGMKMLPTLTGGEELAGRQALLYALLILPVSLLPGVRGDAGILYTLVAFALGCGYVAAAGAFAWKATRRTARALLLVSLAYLPAVLSAALFDPVVSSVLRN